MNINGSTEFPVRLTEIFQIKTLQENVQINYDLCSTLSSKYASCQWQLSTPQTLADCRTLSPAYSC